MHRDVGEELVVEAKLHCALRLARGLVLEDKGDVLRHDPLAQLAQGHGRENAAGAIAKRQCALVLGIGLVERVGVVEEGLEGRHLLCQGLHGLEVGEKAGGLVGGAPGHQVGANVPDHGFEVGLGHGLQEAVEGVGLRCESRRFCSCRAGDQGDAGHHQRRGKGQGRPQWQLQGRNGRRRRHPALLWAKAAAST
jgi:hypothetical protein